MCLFLPVYFELCFTTLPFLAICSFLLRIQFLSPLRGDRARAQDGRDASLLQLNHADVEALACQMPSISDTLQMLRLPLERHIGRASDLDDFAQLGPDDIFRSVLGMLWESVVEPIIRALALEVNWFHLSQTVLFSRAHYNF